MKVVIVGGGFGGITAARELAGAGIEDLSVTLLDPSPNFYIGFTKLWVATGARKPDECQHPRASLDAEGVRILQQAVSSIDLDTKTLVAGAETLAYDRLIVGCGLEVRPDLVEGLNDQGFNLYSMEGAEKFSRELSGLGQGTVHLLVCAPPFKCPPAPYEISLMVDDVLRKNGVRQNIRIVLSTPEPRPLPSLPEGAGETISALFKERDIDLRMGRKVTGVASGKVEFETEVDEFTILGAVPPHRSPAIVQTFAPLVTPAGLIPVDRSTLRTNFDDVYAIGDVAGVMNFKDQPIPRAGIIAEAEARVVASQIVSGILGIEPITFDGNGSCFLEVGDGKAFKIEGEFLNPSGPTYTMSAQASAGVFEEKLKFETDRVTAWFKE